MLGRVRCCVISFDSVSGRSVVWTLGLVCWLFCSSRSLVQEVRALTELAAPLRRVLGELGEGGAAGLVAVQGSGCWAAAVGRGCVNVNVNVNVMSCRYHYRYRYQYRVSSHREMGRKGWSSLCGEVARLSARRDLVPGRWLCRLSSAR